MSFTLISWYELELFHYGIGPQISRVSEEEGEGHLLRLRTFIVSIHTTQTTHWFLFSPPEKNCLLKLLD